MAKIKLVDGTELNITNIELERGILKISTNELSVEELATLFSDKSNTNLITMLTDGGVETGYKTGFTSLAGITYIDGEKTVELFQPVDTTEARIANAEAIANLANTTVDKVNKQLEDNARDIGDMALAIIELYEKDGE